jgi:uncharacterized protein YqgC (DUF456 family)
LTAANDVEIIRDAFSLGKAMKLLTVLTLTALVMFSLTGCYAPTYAQRGAGLGAVTGALAGTAIGHHNGDTAAGTLLGAAAGTLAGAAIGDTIDHEVARSEAIIEERLGRRLAGATTVNDVIAMSQAGLSDDVIATHMRANGVSRTPSVDELITLRNSGVSDTVIKAMQQTPQPTPQFAAPGAPVIIEEHHYVAPTFPYHHHHHRSGPHHRRGVHWGVSFGH